MTIYSGVLHTDIYTFKPIGSRQCLFRLEQEVRKGVYTFLRKREVFVMKLPMQQGEDNYVEIDAQEDKARKIPIQIDKISEYADSDRVQRKVREGCIMLVNVKELKSKNINELKRAIERIRKTTDAIGGEIVGAGDEWIIVSPAIATIMRQ